MRQVTRGAFWVGAYLLLVLTPLVALLIGPKSVGNGWVWDFSLGLGFAGTALMGGMFVLTARFRRPAAPFGIDLIYYFHRQIALVCLVFILFHPLILLVREPALWRLLDPRQAPWPVLAGGGSLVALLLLMATSLWRKPLRIHYEAWRIAHALLAMLALGLAMLHIAGAGSYSATPWGHGVWGAFTALWFALLLHIRLFRPWTLLRHPWRVSRVVRERGDATTLVLVPDGHAGCTFQPGQFVWLTLHSSPFALHEHPFSIASSATRADELHLTIKALGDFTRCIPSTRPAARAWIDGPYGAFSIDRHPAAGYVFVAGGIGIAPVMSMLRTLADRGDRRPLLLFYAYQSWERLTFREEIESLQKQLRLEVVYILGAPPFGWTGERGLISTELLARHLPPDCGGHEFFVCGPVPMIELAERGLHRLGVPLSRIHSELFDLV